MTEPPQTPERHTPEHQTPESPTPERIGRARALSLEDRRAMIIEAAIPLLIEHGRAVTSKQIAEAAGIAEGTIFRAFGDKESLIVAVVEQYTDPSPLRKSLAAIASDLPLEQKIHTMIERVRGHFSKLFRMTAIFQEYRPPERPGDGDGFTDLALAIIGEDVSRLNCTPAQAVQLIRLLSFSASVPALNDEGPMSDEQITQLVLNGIVGRSDSTSAAADDNPRSLSTLIPTN